MKILMIPDLEKEKALELSLEIGNWLVGNYGSSVFPYIEGMKIIEESDIAIIFGGDGFIMKQAKVLAEYNIPLIGINLGTLGFLATAERDNWQEVLKKVAEGKYKLKVQHLLSVTHSGLYPQYCLEAVGDVYIRHMARMIIFRVVADQEIIFDNIRGDGVVVATPMGATAYNLSAGGPLIKKGVVITPICPHPLRLRSRKLREYREIQITYLGVKGPKDESCLLFVDGNDYPIKPSDEVRISQSSKKASFIIPKGFSFSEARKKKLELST